MKTHDYVCYFDGACAPVNPKGAMGTGAIIYDKEEKIVYTHSQYIEPNFQNSNNVAEHLALSAILEYFITHKLTDKSILVKGDSMLVVKQMLGEWRIKHGRYTEAARRNKAFWERFTDIDIEWIPREENGDADAYSTMCIPAEYREFILPQRRKKLRK